MRVRSLILKAFLPSLLLCSGQAQAASWSEAWTAFWGKLATSSSDIQVAGDHFPAQSDLSGLFSKTIPAQGNEGTCHIYAALDLAEAYCNRISGRTAQGKEPLQFSREYVTYRHMRTQLPELLSMGSKFEDDKLLSSYLDSGFPENTLRRILNNSVLTEQEFSTDQALEQVFATLKIKSKDFSSDKMLPIAEQALDTYFLKKISHGHLEAQVSSNGGYYATSQDPDVLSCLATHSELETMPYELKLSLGLLAHQNPFIWYGNFKFKSGVTSLHAIVVDGYRYNPALDANIFPGHIEFHIRNSSEVDDAWGFHLDTGIIVFLSPERLTDVPGTVQLDI